MNTEQRIRAALIDLDADPVGALPAAPLVRVVVVCDEPILRAALCRELGASRLVEASAAAETAEIAARLPELHEADVVLAVHHPLCRADEILGYLDGTPLVVLAHIQAQEDVAAALDAGVTGVLSRQASLEQIIDTLRVARHNVQISPRVETTLTLPAGDALSQQLKLPGEAAGSLLEMPATSLTARERQIVQLIVDDYSIKQIATRLGIALQTTKNHVHHVMVKVGATTRLQLYAWALAHGFAPSGAEHDGSEAAGGTSAAGG